MPPSEPQHIPVLPNQVVQWLRPQPEQFLVDGTLGGGGHTRLLAEAVGSQGTVLAMDRDPAAVEAAEQNLKGLPVKVTVANFCNLPEILEEIDVASVDGILLDLGISSDQLADRDRGFSFDADGPLDLRMNPEEGDPAWRLVNSMRPESLADLIYQYGEERYSRRIARAIEKRRKEQPIRSATELAAIVRRCVPKTEKIDPATRTFQALRIAVNDELKSLEIALERLPNCLKPGGRLAMISFHSLEDRRVKQAFRDDDRLQVLTRRPICAEETEVQSNPRSRSAKMRVAERTID